jgi:hypothetical protein
MEGEQHEISKLFQQLGLPADTQSIENFIKRHRPLPADIKLTEASFWDDSQRAMLKQAYAEDADWAVLFDQLNVRLR